MKIILLGYMASGKSTIGKQLSKKLDINFLDLDDYICKKENSSIEHIFKTKGEIYFRKIEHQYLKEVLAKKDDFVLSLGGGTPCYANNMSVIKNADATSIYIQVSVSNLVARLLNEKAKRPLVASLNDDLLTEFVAKHLFERRFYYEQATKTIQSDAKKVFELVAEIEKTLY